MRAPGMEQEALTSKRKRAGGGDCDDEPPEEHVNTSCHVQILGTGMDTQDTVPSVLLFFDKKRFIFNAGEGLQRFCTEHKTKLSRIDDVFLTRVCSETAGGFPGLLLTLAGTGEEKSQKTATFEDGLEEEAEKRKHSTIMQAVNMGTSGGAYRIILTHFSQRYPN